MWASLGLQGGPKNEATMFDCSYLQNV